MFWYTMRNVNTDTTKCIFIVVVNKWIIKNTLQITMYICLIISMSLFHVYIVFLWRGVFVLFLFTWYLNKTDIGFWLIKLMSVTNYIHGYEACSRGLVVWVVDSRPIGLNLARTPALALRRCASKIWFPCGDLDGM